MVPSCVRHRSLAAAVCASWFVFLSACASTAWHPVAPPPQPTVSAACVLAEATDPEQELLRLTGERSPAALLRRAFLELQRHRPQAAVDAVAEVLHGPSKPSPEAEAFARYLRAEAYAALGKHERAEFDRLRARELALDTELVRRLQAAPVRTAAVPAPAAAVAPGASLQVHPRAAWDPQRADRRNLEPMGQPYRVTIHHSAMYFRDTRPAACAAQIQAIQREHMLQRGYGDIGYHFLIDPSGRVWEGRDLRWQGAHASGENNVRNIGVCVLGNFLRGRGGQGPSAAQVHSMRHLVHALMRQYGIADDAIHCHSDFKATQCPGPLLETAVAELLRDLRGSARSPSRVEFGRVAAVPHAALPTRP